MIRITTLFDEVAVSAGVRGTQIIVAPQDYIAATGPMLCEIARPKTA